jgi:hypothetical protein
VASIVHLLVVIKIEIMNVQFADKIRERNPSES